MTIRAAHLCTVDLTARFLLVSQMESLLEEGVDVSVVCAPGAWISQVEARGIRHIRWKYITRAWRPASDVRAAIELLQILRRERFDLVHTHNPKPGLLGRVLARVAGVPNVINTVHGFYVRPEDPWTRRIPMMQLEKFAARFSDLELYQSEEDLDWARQLNISDDRRRVLLGNGANFKMFDPSNVQADRSKELRAELGIADEAVVVGTVGRVVAEKGHRELFEATRRLKRVVPHLVLLAVGDVDPDKPDSVGLQEAAEAGGIITGWRENVHELIALMDVFVLASWREGVPRSAIEAAAMRKPMVLTNIRGCREVARHEKEALLVPPRDATALAGAIRRLIEDPELSERLATAARQRAVRLFDEERVAERVAAHTLHLLRRSGKLPVSASANHLIRHALPVDATVLADLHTQALGSAFLPRLGKGFLTHLYKTMTADRNSVVLVAEAGGTIVGFVAGTLSVKRFYRRFLVRRGIPAAVAALPRLIRPSIVKAALETARYPGESGSLPDQELLAIGVAPEAQGTGVGRKLGQTFLAELETLGADEVKVVVARDNSRANRLYEKLGFEFATEIGIHGDTRSNVWIKRWSSPSASSPH